MFVKLFLSLQSAYCICLYNIHNLKNFQKKLKCCSEDLRINLKVKYVHIGTLQSIKQQHCACGLPKVTLNYYFVKTYISIVFLCDRYLICTYIPINEDIEVPTSSCDDRDMRVNYYLSTKSKLVLENFYFYFINDLAFFRCLLMFVDSGMVMAWSSVDTE